MTEGGEYSPVMMSADPFMSMKKIKKSNNNNNQRRFSDVQIKSLELMFESETRLEPKKRVQLARELGLQPRQLAIWFQNKRACWKSKQLETEYNILRQNYNNLASQFESLKKEKQTFVSELQRLNETMQKTKEEERQCYGDQAVVALTSTDYEENRKCERKIYDNGHHEILSGDDDDDVDVDDDGYNNNMKREYFGGFEEEADHLMRIVEPTDSSSHDWGPI